MLLQDNIRCMEGQKGLSKRSYLVILPHNIPQWLDSTYFRDIFFHKLIVLEYHIDPIVPNFRQSDQLLATKLID